MTNEAMRSEECTKGSFTWHTHADAPCAAPPPWAWPRRRRERRSAIDSECSATPGSGPHARWNYQSQAVVRWSSQQFVLLIKRTVQWHDVTQRITSTQASTPAAVRTRAAPSK